MLIVSCSEDKYAWKDEEKQEAMNNCLDTGNKTEFCSCSVEILASLFTYEEFYDYDKQIRDKKQPSSEITSRMIEMSKQVYSNCK